MSGGRFAGELAIARHDRRLDGLDIASTLADLDKRAGDRADHVTEKSRRRYLQLDHCPLCTIVPSRGDLNVRDVTHAILGVGICGRECCPVVLAEKETRGVG